MVNYLVEWQHCATRDLVNYCWLKLMFSQLFPWNPHWDRPVEADREHVWKRLRYKTWLVEINIHQSTEKKNSNWMYNSIKIDMGMDQYLPFLGGWTSINPSYFDVNYRGTRFWHTADIKPGHRCRLRSADGPRQRLFQDSLLPDAQLGDDLREASPAIPAMPFMDVYGIGLYPWDISRDMPSGIPYWDFVDDMFIMTP